MWMQADPVARAGYEAVMRGDLVTVPGRINNLLAVFARMLPERIVFAAIKRQVGHFRRVER
jgi:short-subunit dehydrogenase